MDFRGRPGEGGARWLGGRRAAGMWTGEGSWGWRTARKGCPGSWKEGQEERKWRVMGREKKKGVLAVALVRERGKRHNWQGIESIEVRALGRIYPTLGGPRRDRPQPVSLEPRRSGTLRTLAREPKMLGEPHPRQEQSRRWVPGSAGVRSEESLPASVLCAAWRGVWAAADSALPRLPRRPPPAQGVPAWEAGVGGKSPAAGGPLVPGRFQGSPRGNADQAIRPGCQIQKGPCLPCSPL